MISLSKTSGMWSLTVHGALNFWSCLSLPERQKRKTDLLSLFSFLKFIKKKEMEKGDRRGSLNHNMERVRLTCIAPSFDTACLFSSVLILFYIFSVSLDPLSARFLYWLSFSLAGENLK